MLWFLIWTTESNSFPKLLSQSTKPPVYRCSWNKTKCKISSDTGKNPKEELGDCSIRNFLLPICGIPKRCSFGCHKQLVLLSLERSPAAEMQLPALFQAIHTWRNKHISTPTSLAVKDKNREFSYSSGLNGTFLELWRIPSDQKTRLQVWTKAGFKSANCFWTNRMYLR